MKKTPLVLLCTRAACVLAVIACMVVLPACDESEVSNVRIVLNDDLSGTVRSTRLVVPADAGAQTGLTGVKVQAAAQIVSVRGEFASLSDLKLEELMFSAERTSKGFNVVRVTLPRGPGVKWPAKLTEASASKRSETAKALDPDGKDSRMGSVVGLTMKLPSPPVSHGVSIMAAGLSESVEKNTVTLLVPVDLALREGDAITWDVTWK